MGYIAPVNNYQYQHYAERVISKPYNPYRFVPISTIKPLENPRKDHQHEQPFHPSSSSFTPIQTLKESNQFHEKVYSDLTGIGLIFNEYV